MKIRSKLILLSAILSLFGAQESFANNKSSNDWIIRARGVFVKTDVTTNSVQLGGNVTTTSDFIPELDFTKFITRNIAAELILGTSRHNLELKNSAAGTLPLGQVNLLPPTLTAQYHFNPAGKFRPYAGAGVNYTLFYGSKATSNATVTDVKYKNQFGYALQAGFDYMLDEKISFNFDVKKIFLRTKANINGGAYQATVQLDPWLIGAGIGYHF